MDMGEGLGERGLSLPFDVVLSSYKRGFINRQGRNIMNAKSLLNLFAGLLGLLAAACASAASTADADTIFNWAERSYPSLLFPPATSATAGEYYYRYYTGSASFVAVKGERVLYLPANTPIANVVDVGSVAALLAQASPAAGNFALTSTAFTEGQTIPVNHACADMQGKDMSPPLAWSGAPAGTQSFALLADDPDAPGGTWTHWIIYNIPAATTSLTEGYPLGASQSGGVMQGLSDWGVAGYGGMCPPSGTHRYYFKLYALKGVLNLAPGAKRSDFLAAINGAVLGEASLMGRYSAK